mmetsp:Transcript_20933/g.52673  ORF Transcript_20933/g.52673 Transcript_20933/m.52673 type:complete len:225 (+) Transcript_20933:133-807(+)
MPIVQYVRGFVYCGGGRRGAWVLPAQLERVRHEGGGVAQLEVIEQLDAQRGVGRVVVQKGDGLHEEHRHGARDDVVDAQVAELQRHHLPRVVPQPKGDELPHLLPDDAAAEVAPDAVRHRPDECDHPRVAPPPSLRSPWRRRRRRVRPGLPHVYAAQRVVLVALVPVAPQAIVRRRSPARHSRHHEQQRPALPRCAEEGMLKAAAWPGAAGGRPSQRGAAPAGW